VWGFYEKDGRCQGKSILGLGPFLFCSPDPASIRTFGEPLVWGSVLFEVQSASRRCYLSLGVHGPSGSSPPVQCRSRRNTVWNLQRAQGRLFSPPVSFRKALVNLCGFLLPSGGLWLRSKSACGIERFLRDPQSMHQDHQLAPHRHDRPLLSILATAEGQRQTPSP
jgi:hypothetical protein